MNLFSILLICQAVVIAVANDKEWKDTALTKQLLTIISNHDTDGLVSLLSDRTINPPASFRRSADGKGPLFWAYEYDFKEGIRILEEIGVDKTSKDSHGRIPSDYKRSGAKMSGKPLGGDVEWADSDVTESLFRACSTRNTEALIDILSDTSIVPPASMLRSSDGRGPLFWAYEYGHTAGIQILEEIGADPYARDVNGKTPRQLGEDNEEWNRQHMHLGSTTTDNFAVYDDDDYMDESDDSEF